MTSVPSPDDGVLLTQTAAAYYLPGEHVLSGAYRHLRNNRWLLLTSTLIGAVLGAGLALSGGKVYRSSVLLEIQGLNDNFLNIKDVTPVTDSSSTVSLDDIQTQIKILQSKSLLERVYKRVNGRRGPKTFRQGEVLNEHLLDAIASNLSVRQVGRTRMVEASYDCPDPKGGAEFVNTLASEFIDQSVESRWKMSQRTGEWINKQLEDVRGKLVTSEATLNSYAESSGLMFFAQGQNISEEKLRMLQEELSRAQADRIARQSEYASAQSAAAVSASGFEADSPSSATVLVDLRRQLAQLLTDYTPEYSKVKQVKAEISSLENSIQNTHRAHLDELRQHYEQASRRERTLSAHFDEVTQNIKVQGAKEVQYNVLKREAESNRQLYDSLLQRMREATVAAAIRATNIRIADAARPALYPFQPKPMMAAELGSLGGLLAGVGIVFCRVSRRAVIQHPGEIHSRLSLSELGPILSIPVKMHSVASASEHTAINSEPMHKRDLGQAPHDDHCLLELKTGSSLAAQSFRSVLTSIRFSSRMRAHGGVVVVTSSWPSEGKTTVTSNIAIGMTEIYRRVLVIDGDLHRPRLHEVFGCTNTTGLREVLCYSGGTAFHMLGDVVKATDVNGLFLLSSGQKSGDGSKLIQSERLMTVIEAARKQFDAVLIDSPPMIDIPDARVLGRQTDGVILVVRAGKTTFEAVVAAKQRLSGDGTVIIGTILNDWDPKSSPGGYYGRSPSYN